MSAKISCGWVGVNVIYVSLDRHGQSMLGPVLGFLCCCCDHRGRWGALVDGNMVGDISHVHISSNTYNI